MDHSNWSLSNWRSAWHRKQRMSQVRMRELALAKIFLCFGSFWTGTSASEQDLFTSSCLARCPLLVSWDQSMTDHCLEAAILTLPSLQILTKVGNVFTYNRHFGCLFSHCSWIYSNRLENGSQGPGAIGKVRASILIYWRLPDENKRQGGTLGSSQENTVCCRWSPKWNEILEMRVICKYSSGANCPTG